MLNLAFAAFTLAAIVLLVVLIWTLGLWMKNISVIALPGLGIMVGTRFAFFMECIAEIVLILIAAYLVRFLPFVRDLIEMTGGVAG
jgi:hypothetical protein